ncbi:hypothetical protein [Aneurinibacillus migulanus]|nr:hypothetical protein [Aneurinibacillus migulanus]
MTDDLAAIEEKIEIDHQQTRTVISEKLGRHMRDIINELQRR